MSASEGAVAKAGSRREGRERVLGLLYEAESKELPLSEVVASLPLPVHGYAARLLEGLGDDLEAVDAAISEVSHNWRLDRMPAVDRALLRIATHELMERPDIPAGAVISEAVELGAEYSTDGSSRFLNGVLAKLAERCRPEESVA